MLPTDPGDTEWKDDGTRKVTPWKYLGTHDVGEGEEARFRARLCRYDSDGGFMIEPEVQFRWRGEWSNGIRATTLDEARAHASSAVHAAKRALA